MLTQEGRVVAVEADGIWVETESQSVCGRCSARLGCGHTLFARGEKNIGHVKALFTENTTVRNWSVGDYATIGVAENAFLYTCLISFGLPLLTMILAIALANYYSSYSDYVVAASGLAGLVFGGLIVRYLAHNYQYGNRLRLKHVLSVQALGRSRTQLGIE